MYTIVEDITTKELTKMKKIGIFAAVLVVLFGVLFYATTNNTQDSKVYTMMTVSDLEQKMNDKESFTVYLYSPTCSHCIEFNPILEKFLTDNNYKIGKLNVDDGYSDLSRLLGDKFQGTPSIFTFKDGEIQDYSVGKKSAEELVKYQKKNPDAFTV